MRNVAKQLIEEIYRMEDDWRYRVVGPAPRARVYVRVSEKVSDIREQIFNGVYVTEENAMKSEDPLFASLLESDVSVMTRRLNSALTDINGAEHLPLWLDKAVNAPVFTVSADTLQGMKIGMAWVVYRARLHLGLENEEYDPSRKKNAEPKQVEENAGDGV